MRPPPPRVATCLFFLLLLRPSPAVAGTWAGPSAASASIGNRDGRRRLARVSAIRGGSYELNPNHRGSPTLGDVDNDGVYRLRATFPSPSPNGRRRPPPLAQSIKNYFEELRRYSPTLFHGTVASIFLYAAWQLPPSSFVTAVLRNHFVTSSRNVLRGRRCHALVASALSHADFRHLAINLYAFLTFGRSVKQVLQTQGLGLWPFAVSAAAFGNLTFLAFDQGRGSCIGLSGVTRESHLMRIGLKSGVFSPCADSPVFFKRFTVALLAFDALVYPTKELRFFVSFIPMTLPAYYVFLGLLGFSVLGILGLVGRSNVAHSTHLGGLVYGFLFYEAFRRGWPRLWSYRLRKSYRSLRGG